MANYEVWVQANRRPLYLLLAIAGCLAFGSAITVYLAAYWLRIAAGVLFFPSALAVVALLIQLRTPRVAYDQQDLILYLLSGNPARVPIELVECFLAGQGATMLDEHATHQPPVESANVVIKIADSAEQYQQREVMRTLGSWCGGYITLRGTWCEPIGEPLLRRLNQRLVDVHRQRRQRKGAASEK